MQGIQLTPSDFTCSYQNPGKCDFTVVQKVVGTQVCRR